jgi:60 kDa SS-A/Ro ribonucleoprotein
MSVAEAFGITPGRNLRIRVPSETIAAVAGPSPRGASMSEPTADKKLTGAERKRLKREEHRARKDANRLGIGPDGAAASETMPEVAVGDAPITGPIAETADASKVHEVLAQLNAEVAANEAADAEFSSEGSPVAPVGDACLPQAQGESPTVVAQPKLSAKERKEAAKSARRQAADDRKAAKHAHRSGTAVVAKPAEPVIVKAPTETAAEAAARLEAEEAAARAAENIATVAEPEATSEVAASVEAPAESVIAEAPAAPKAEAEAAAPVRRTLVERATDALNAMRPGRAKKAPVVEAPVVEAPVVEAPVFGPVAPATLADQALADQALAVAEATSHPVTAITVAPLSAAAIGEIISRRVAAFEAKHGAPAPKATRPQKPGSMPEKRVPITMVPGPDGREITSRQEKNRLKGVARLAKAAKLRELAPIKMRRQQILEERAARRAWREQSWRMLRGETVVEPITADVKMHLPGHLVDPFDRLTRFLLLGSDEGCYQASGREMKLEAATSLKECLALDPVKTVETIVAFGKQRKVDPEPAIFSLAMVAAGKFGDSPAHEMARLSAIRNMQQICIPGSDMLLFADFYRKMGGKFTKPLRHALKNWYFEQPLETLADDILSRPRAGSLTHTRLLQLVHPDRADSKRNSVLRYATAGAAGLGEGEVKRFEGDAALGTANRPHRFDARPAIHQPLPAVIRGAEIARNAGSDAEIIEAIDRFALKREHVPREARLASPAICGALAAKMSIAELLANLPEMACAGWVAAGSEGAEEICRRLAAGEAVDLGLLPWSLLTAWRTYASGVQATMRWSPLAAVSKSLEKAFYDALSVGPRLNSRLLLSINPSVAMRSQAVLGKDGEGVTALDGASALAIWLMKLNDGVTHVTALGQTIRSLDVNQGHTLTHLAREIGSAADMTADSREAIRYAKDNGLKIDDFVVLTNRVVEQGDDYDSAADILDNFRSETGIGAKLATLCLASTSVGMADRFDRGMLDFAGFDAKAQWMLLDHLSGPPVGSRRISKAA